MRGFSTTALLSLALSLAACSGSSDGSPTATPDVTPVNFATTRLHIEAPQGARDIDVEIASTAEQSERGLGHRDALLADAGMIFDLHEVRLPTFWMKGMRFPLDIVWIGEDKRVVGVTANVQPEAGVSDEQLRRYSFDAPVRYVLEVNAGTASRLGLADGSQLMFVLP